MRVFTTSRLENNVNSRNTKLKLENSSMKIDSSGISEIGKDERGPASVASGQPAPASVSSIQEVL